MRPIRWILASYQGLSYTSRLGAGLRSVRCPSLRCPTLRRPRGRITRYSSHAAPWTSGRPGLICHRLTEAEEVRKRERDERDRGTHSGSYKGVVLGCRGIHRRYLVSRISRSSLVVLSWRDRVTERAAREYNVITIMFDRMRRRDNPYHKCTSAIAANQVS
jgi:hypothetical protein